MQEVSALSWPDGAKQLATRVARIAATLGPTQAKSKAAVLLSEPHATADAGGSSQSTAHGQARACQEEGAHTFFVVVQTCGRCEAPS